MTDLSAFKADPRSVLLDALEQARAVMLGNPAAGRTMQPMAPHLDRADGSIWFFTKTDTDLVKGLDGAADDVVCTVTAPDFDLFASITGRLRENRDAARIDRFWDDTTAAWFEHGREDPLLTMLEFRPEEAAVWASTGDPDAFAWEIARANREADTPDVGASRTVRFAA